LNNLGQELMMLSSSSNFATLENSRSHNVMSSTTTMRIEAGKTATETRPALNISRDNAGGIKRLHHIPWPETALERRRWQLEQMAGAFRVFAKLGFADGGSGHISVRGKITKDAVSNK
jgi:hypothetical protein